MGSEFIAFDSCWAVIYNCRPPGTTQRESAINYTPNFRDMSPGVFAAQMFEFTSCTHPFLHEILSQKKPTHKNRERLADLGRRGANVMQEIRFFSSILASLFLPHSWSHTVFPARTAALKSFTMSHSNAIVDFTQEHSPNTLHLNPSVFLY